MEFFLFFNREFLSIGLWKSTTKLYILISFLLNDCKSLSDSILLCFKAVGWMKIPLVKFEFHGDLMYLERDLVKNVLYTLVSCDVLKPIFWLKLEHTYLHYKSFVDKPVLLVKRKMFYPNSVASAVPLKWIWRLPIYRFHYSSIASDLSQLMLLLVCILKTFDIRVGRSICYISILYEFCSLRFVFVDASYLGNLVVHRPKNAVQDTRLCPWLPCHWEFNVAKTFPHYAFMLVPLNFPAA